MADSCSSSRTCNKRKHRSCWIDTQGQASTKRQLDGFPSPTRLCQPRESPSLVHLGGVSCATHSNSQLFSPWLPGPCSLTASASKPTRPAAHGWPAPRSSNPVCALGRNGTRATYANACVARASGARILHAGECLAGSPFSCFLIYSPVCARNLLGIRRTYSNLCEAELANAVVLSNGPCR